MAFGHVKRELVGFLFNRASFSVLRRRTPAPPVFVDEFDTVCRPPKNDPPLIAEAD